MGISSPEETHNPEGMTVAQGRDDAVGSTVGTPVRKDLPWEPGTPRIAAFSPLNRNLHLNLAPRFGGASSREHTCPDRANPSPWAVTMQLVL